jgi:hypothetical protein
MDFSRCVLPARSESHFARSQCGRRCRTGFVGFESALAADETRQAGSRECVSRERNASDSILKAKTQIVDVEARKTFVSLGDPAMTIKQPTAASHELDYSIANWAG